MKANEHTCNSRNIKNNKTNQHIKETQRTHRTKQEKKNNNARQEKPRLEQNRTDTNNNIRAAMHIKTNDNTIQSKTRKDKTNKTA